MLPLQVGSAHLDTWGTSEIGPLSLSGEWQLYPRSGSTPFKYPPAITIRNDRRALRMKTDHESMKIWREVRVDVSETSQLVWEWKALALPEGGDVRTSKRNDQAARNMVLFEGLKAILYVRDTVAPISTEGRPDEVVPLDRALVVARPTRPSLGSGVRSGETFVPIIAASSRNSRPR